MLILLDTQSSINSELLLLGDLAIKAILLFGVYKLAMFVKRRLRKAKTVESPTHEEGAVYKNKE